MFHYVYQIIHILNNKKYIGCRSSKLKPIDDIGIKYFSSSRDKEFKKDQIENPQNYKYEILAKFKSRLKAIEYEAKLHKKNNVDLNESYYNRAIQNQRGIDFTGRNHTIESRKKIGDASKLRGISIEARKKLSISHKGRKPTAEARKKMSDAKKGEKNHWYGKNGPMSGKKHTNETKIKMSKSHSGINHPFHNKNHKPESKEKMSLAKLGDKNPKYWLGKKRSAETLKKISENRKGKYKGVKQKTIICPHCNKLGGNATMPRWHFNNCKQKPIDI